MTAGKISDWFKISVLIGVGIYSVVSFAGAVLQEEFAASVTVKVVECVFYAYTAVASVVCIYPYILYLAFAVGYEVFL